MPDIVLESSRTSSWISVNVGWSSFSSFFGWMRDTGDMIAATRKIGRGFSRIVRCYDPAGLMNEFGTSSMPPRPWLLVHADAGADAVEQGLLRDLNDFLR